MDFSKIIDQGVGLWSCCYYSRCFDSSCGSCLPFFSSGIWIFRSAPLLVSSQRSRTQDQLKMTATAAVDMSELITIGPRPSRKDNNFTEYTLTVKALMLWLICGGHFTTGFSELSEIIYVNIDFYIHYTPSARLIILQRLLSPAYQNTAVVFIKWFLLSTN